MILVRLFTIFICLCGLVGQGSACAAQLTVFAASSLTEAMRSVAKDYETSHSGERILLSFAGSQTLATQIEQGAPADLFISANKLTMERLQNKNLVKDSQPLLSNRLILALRKDLQPGVRTVSDLARPDLLLAIGNPQVPVGYYTRLLFSGLSADPSYGATLVKKIEKNVVSEENRDRVIVAKLLLGEVDVGIVYQSDLATVKTKSLLSLALPQQHNPLVVYPMAKVCGGAAGIDAFITYLRTDRSQEIFARFGFGLEGQE